MRVIVWLLCAIGFYVSARMQLKTIEAAADRLDEPSVVQTPRARLFGGVPNSTLGLVFYSLMAVAAFFFDDQAVRIAMLCLAVPAALVSFYLAYSLLCVTRMPCVNCWVGHVTNWLLLGYLAAEVVLGRS